MTTGHGDYDFKLKCNDFKPLCVPTYRVPLYAPPRRAETLNTRPSGAYGPTHPKPSHGKVCIRWVAIVPCEHCQHCGSGHGAMFQGFCEYSA